jgi:hypothetical protein
MLYLYLLDSHEETEAWGHDVVYMIICLLMLLLDLLR